MPMYNEEQTKRPNCPFMKQTTGILRYNKEPKTSQHTLELLHVYQYVLELPKELLNVSVCQRVAKLQMIKVFQATLFCNFM